MEFFPGISCLIPMANTQLCDGLPGRAFCLLLWLKSHFQAQPDQNRQPRSSLILAFYSIFAQTSEDDASRSPGSLPELLHLRLDSLKHGVTKNCPRGTSHRDHTQIFRIPISNSQNSFLQSCISWTIIKTSKLFPFFFFFKFPETNQRLMR